MQLELIDWAIIVGYFALTLGIGAWFTRRAGSNIAEFFISGRSLPWWVAGTSMVATTFAADTPLAVTGLIVKNGLAGNWFWWAFAIGGMFTVFVYARMWRRAEVMTDVELIKLRYDGKAANGLRYLRSFYVAMIVNPIIIGWVIGAMLLILEQTVFFDTPIARDTESFWNRDSYAWLTVVLMMLVVGIYSTLSGMWGVVIADMLQFCLAMGGCIWLAVVAVNHVGGIEQLQAKIEANYGSQQAFEFLPSVTTGALASEQVSQLGSDADEESIQASELNAAQSALQAGHDLLEMPNLGVVAEQAIQKRMKQVQEQVNALPAEAFQSDYWDGSENKDRTSPYKQLNKEVELLQSSIGKATPGPWILLHVFLIMLTMQWWATWYPGAEPGGGGYVVQRMAACKDEKNAVLATLWYQIAHYCVRPWPWIMISFVALAVYPELRANYIADSDYDPGIGFPMIMRELCTPGLSGLMLVAFFAAFMSTMSTQMNWGASYLVRDFAQPLFLKDADDKTLTQASRIISILILMVGFLFGIFMKYPSLLTGGPGDQNEAVSVDDAWKFLAALGAGTGLVFMLRWFWWRINAWSEIVAMIASLGYFLALNYIPWVKTNLLGGHELRAEEQMAMIAGLTIMTWVLATFITRPESDATLCNFFEKIRPGGPGWKPIAAKMPTVQQDKNLGISIVGALFASGIVYLTLPAIGFLIFGKTEWAIACFVGAAACAVVVGIITNRIFK